MDTYIHTYHNIQTSIQTFVPISEILRNSVFKRLMLLAVDDDQEAERQALEGRQREEADALRDEQEAAREAEKERLDAEAAAAREEKEEAEKVADEKRTEERTARDERDKI